jgi:hypothetical protein
MQWPLGGRVLRHSGFPHQQNRDPDDPAKACLTSRLKTHPSQPVSEGSVAPSSKRSIYVDLHISRSNALQVCHGLLVRRVLAARKDTANK